MCFTCAGHTDAEFKILQQDVANLKIEHKADRTQLLRSLNPVSQKTQTDKDLGQVHIDVCVHTAFLGIAVKHGYAALYCTPKTAISQMNMHVIKSLRLTGLPHLG